MVLGDVAKNTQDICDYIAKADQENCDIVVFPELCLTGYTCQDLFFQDALLQGVKDGLKRLLDCSAEHPAVTAAVGLPVVIGGQMYNCGAVISGGKLLGFGSACPYYDPEVSYLDDISDTYYGEALAVVQAGAGDQLTVSVSDGTLSAQAFIAIE